MKLNHIMCTTKILTNLYLTKQKIKAKKYFCKYCLQCFRNKKVLNEHKDICLKTNCKRIVKLREGFIELKSYSG